LGSSLQPTRIERVLDAVVMKVIARPGRVATLALLLAIVSAGFAALRLRVHVDTVSMFDTELPHLERWYAFAERYPLLAEPLIVVVDGPPGLAAPASGALAEAMRARPDLFAEVRAPRANAFLERHGLLYLESEDLAALADRLIEVQPAIAALDQDPTLPGLFRLLEQALVQRSRLPGDEMHQLLTGIDSEVRAARSPPGTANPFLDLVLDSGEAAQRAVVLALARHRTEGMNPVRTAIDSVQTLARERGLTPEHGYRVRVTGDLALSADELELVNENAWVTGLAAFVLVTGILLVGLRDARLVLALCLTLLAGLAYTAGFAALSVGRLNMISAAFAVMSIGLGIDFGIHLVMRYREFAEGNRPRRAALRRAVAVTGPSLLLCATTSAVGFYSFLPTAFAGLAEFGLISGSGMILSFAATPARRSSAAVSSRWPSGWRRPRTRVSRRETWGPTMAR
jgi:predicted exporter